MPTLLAMLALAAAPQTVRVILPDAAVVAAARLPVPNVVMTRAQADALSDAMLAERLIGHIPHRPIAGVQRQREDAGGRAPGQAALGWVSFSEAAVPIGGRLCRSRSILVTFDTLDGKVEGSSLSTRPADRPRRVFSVSQTPTVAVLGGAADARSCARAKAVMVPPARADEAVALIRQVTGAGRDFEGARLAVTCSDRLSLPPRRCDPRQALAAIDWTRLLSVGRTAFTGEPVQWHLRADAGRGQWIAVVTDTAAGRQVELRRENPPPF